MKKTNIVAGLVLILLAVYLVLNESGMLPGISWFRIFLTLFMAYLAIRSIPKLNFFGIILPICVLGCMYDTELGIEAITPWTLLLAGVLLSGGLRLLFKRRKQVEFVMNMDMNGKNVIEDDGEVINVSNHFKSVSKYVNTDSFRTAHIENNFGSCNVYFNNAVMTVGKAEIELENSFGDMNVYLPKTWRVELISDESFGHIKVMGTGNADMDAPFVNINADSNFGNITIFFE